MAKLEAHKNLSYGPILVLVLEKNRIKNVHKELDKINKKITSQSNLSQKIRRLIELGILNKEGSNRNGTIEINYEGIIKYILKDIIKKDIMKNKESKERTKEEMKENLKRNQIAPKNPQFLEDIYNLEDDIYIDSISGNRRIQQIIRECLVKYREFPTYYKDKGKYIPGISIDVMLRDILKFITIAHIRTAEKDKVFSEFMFICITYYIETEMQTNPLLAYESEYLFNLFS